MRDRPFNLAIETSGPLGSVTLGQGDELLQSIELPPQQRHTVDLMPTIDRLCRGRGVAPGQLGEVYVSSGPGSFTGLRIGIATVKMLAQALEVRVVAVPTLDVMAQNAPAPEAGQADAARLAICLNVKRETGFAGVYRWDAGQWLPEGEPGLATVAEVLARIPHARPVYLLGEPLPPLPEPMPGHVKILTPELAVARSAVVWRLGRALAGRGQFIDPLLLLPLYSRRPEAEELWEKRHPAAAPGAGVKP